MANEKTRIIVAGPRGRMGSETLRLIEETEHFQLVGAVDSKNNEKKVSELEGLPAMEAPVYVDAARCLADVDADVFIDFTVPEVGGVHAEMALKQGVHPVIGTSGFTQQKVNQLAELAEKTETGTIIAPNFAIGAVLMMKFSRLAAKFLSDVEIIEQHHAGKLDAPSGTAAKTAQMVAEVRDTNQQEHPDAKAMDGARGAAVGGVPIHSVRLPGLVAHQEVIFGGESETLRIRHDSIHRKSFMTGVKLAVETVMGLNVLVYGLENILE